MTEQGIRYRNRGKAAYASLPRHEAGRPSIGGDAGLPAQRHPAPAPTAAGTVEGAWVEWLSPVFAGNDSCYFTGTYSDDYGVPHGLMLARNVHHDFYRWLQSWGFEGRYIVGVEPHRFRDILHLHGILEGPFSKEQRAWLKRWWAGERGHARALPVLDGCASYVTKYALKGDSTAFEWRLT